MDIEFDPAKNIRNLVKHGIDLAIGQRVLENAIGERIDVRQTAEVRIVAFGMVDGRFLSCAYTMRGETARIISVRVASKKERIEWLQGS